METQGQAASFSERLYRALLVAYPKEFRRQYSEQLVQAFGDLYREEFEKRGRMGVLVLWLHTLSDLAVSVFSERSGFLMSTSLIRLGGAAFVLGGILYLVPWWLVFRLVYFGGFTPEDSWSNALTFMPRGPVATDLAAGFVAAGLLTLGIYLVRGAVRGRRSKILIKVGIGLAAMAAVSSVVEVVVGIMVGAHFAGPWSGYMPEDGPTVPPGSLQAVLLDVTSPLAHWTLALASLTLAGALLFARTAGRGWMLPSVTGLLLTVAGLFYLPQAAGLLAFAIWWISYDGFNDPSSLMSPTVLTAPHALVAFGWITVGLLLRSRVSERLEEPARVQ